MRPDTTSKAEAPRCLGWVVSCAIIGVSLFFPLLAVCVGADLGVGYLGVTGFLAGLSFQAFGVIVRLSGAAAAP